VADSLLSGGLRGELSLAAKLPKAARYRTWYLNDFVEDTISIATDGSGDWRRDGSGSSGNEVDIADNNPTTGILELTTDTGKSDWVRVVLDTARLVFSSGKKAWFETRFRVVGNGLLPVHLFIGLYDLDSLNSWLAAGPQLVISSAATTRNIALYVADNSGVSSVVLETLASGELGGNWITVGFAYDGAGSLQGYVDGVVTGAAITTNLPTDQDLSLAIDLNNGGVTAQANTLQVDYIFFAQEK
jgi:hypothetical protein